MDSLRFKPPLGKIERSCAVLCFLFAAGTSANECQNYQNAQLVGTLQQQTFAGPPNYESIAAGDKAERYFLLKLSAPICVNADAQQQEPSFTKWSAVKASFCLLKLVIITPKLYCQQHNAINSTD